MEVPIDCQMAMEFQSLVTDTKWNEADSITASSLASAKKIKDELAWVESPPVLDNLIEPMNKDR